MSIQALLGRGDMWQGSIVNSRFNSVIHKVQATYAKDLFGSKSF